MWLSRIAIFLVFLSTLALANCSGNNRREDARFSYQNVYREKYEQGRGGIIPLTLERGESFSGSITPDGKYLYFSSNRLGNYDLFLRALDDVEIIPVVKTVTNQREPVISPNGKWLAYIDDELDPDGDLVVLKVNPADLIKKYTAGENPQSGIFGSKPKILTNDEKNRVRSREMNPTWSPDGKLLAFSSDMTSVTGNPFGPGLGALQNIWLMDPDKPQAARKLTEQGGVMPAFSPDGKKLAYVSYYDPTGNGDIYEIDLQTLENRQLTSGSALDLNPTYSPDGKFLIFSRIARDSNGDGHIDRKDKAQLMLIPRNTNQAMTEAYPLTTSEENTFDSRASGFVEGSIVFAFTSGENINVAFIPATGVIPRKKSIYEQFTFAEAFHPRKLTAATPSARKKAVEEYIMALRMVLLFHGEDPLSPVLGNLARLKLFQFLAAEKDPQAATEVQKIESLAATTEPLLRVLVDIEKLQGSTLPLPATTPLLTDNNLESYLGKVAGSPVLQQAYQDTDGLKMRNILAYLQDKLAEWQRARGQLQAARATERKILQNHPAYYRAAEILYDQAKAGLAETIPPEVLFILYPEKYPWFSSQDGSDFAARNQALVAATGSELRERLMVLVYEYFQGLAGSGQQVLVRSLTERYPAAQHPELHYLAALAMAHTAAENGQALQAEQSLPQEQQLAANSRWLHLYHRIKGQIHELRNEPAQAFGSYYSAFLNYRPEFQIPGTRSLLQRTLNYFAAQAKEARGHGDYRKAWQQYQVLARLELQLQAFNIEKDLVEESALDTLIAINELTFADPDEDSKFLQQVQEFYNTNMDFARKYLINSFIFGRAHLNAQQGILRHERFEKDGLTNSEKKEVLKLFKAAEQDFKWSFFADPWFPDSYVMLGWMYQFIDTKREKIVDIADNTKDKDKFDSLYRAYFPNYLFEEGIRIYQKSIELFRDRVSSRILLSFHLNMGNNYFLLNNYAKAEENYAVVAAAVERREYSFESPVQQALFHYHAGRTWYYTGRYNRAAAELRKALDIYRNIAPLDNVPPKQREYNRSRRETIMRQLALNSDLSNKPDEAINWYREILSEQKYTGSYHDRSFLFLELARLHYDKRDYQAAFGYLNEAMAALASEKEIKPPRFKIRIKWLGFYEPWTTVVGWIYQLPYDNVYVGENHLAFPLPTVNRYQYLYSLQADIYRQKGLYSQAKGALLKLQDYARQDDSKHGRETLLASHMRLGEIEYLLANLTAARKQYNAAIKLATDSGDFINLQKAEKNLLTIAARELETIPESDRDKIKRAEKELKSLEKFTANYIENRLGAEEAKRKEKNRGIELSQAEKAKIRFEALKEIYKLAIYQGVFHFYLAELKEAQLRSTEKASSNYSDYYKQKEEIRQHFTAAYKLFQGLVADPENPEKDASFLERRDNGMRLALTLNRGRLLQIFNVQSLASKEYRLAYDRAEEFQAARIKAIAGYRLFESSAESSPLVEAYRIFTEQPHLASEYPLLFEQIAEARVAMHLAKNEAAAAIAAEDLKRFILAREIYRGKISFSDPELQKKYEEHTQLYTMEVARMKLVETLRLGREDSSFYEAELQRIRSDRLKLEQQMITGRGSGQLGPIFYRVETPENQILPLLYILEVRGKTHFILVDKMSVIRKRNVVTTEVIYHQGEFLIPESELKQVKEQMLSGNPPTETGWLSWLRANKARQVIVNPRFQDFPIERVMQQPVSLDLALPSARLFGRNHNVTRQRLVQITSQGGGIFGFGGNNAVKYPLAIEQQLVSGLEQWQNTAAGYSVLDYEANLSGSNLALERNELPLYKIMQTAMFPSMVVVHSVKEQSLTPQAEFYYRAALNLISASRGATAVVYLEGNRKGNVPKVAALLSDKISGSETILGSAPMLTYLKYGEKSPELLQLASNERNREFARLKEQGQSDFRTALSRAERARNAEELIYSGPAASFLESEELFNFRTKLLLRSGNADKALAAWKERENLLLQSGRQKEIPGAFGQMLGRIFAAGFTDLGLSELRRSNLSNVMDARDWLRITEGYHLSNLINGRLEVFFSELPQDLQPAVKEQGIRLPAGIAPRLEILTRDSAFLEEWQQALYENLEFRQAYAIQSRRNLGTAQHQDYYRAYIFQNLVDANFVPAWAATWLADIRRSRTSSKALPEDREAQLREDFIQLHVFLRNGDLPRSVEFARQQLVDPNTSREVQDAVIFLFLKDLWKRGYSPTQEKIILDFLAEAGKILQDKETNRQRRAFLEMLKVASSLRNGPDKLFEAAGKSGINTLSAGNQSVMNRLGYYAATWQPHRGTSFGFFQIEEWLEDNQVNERIRYLRKLGETNGQLTADSQWQMALRVDYLRLTGRPEEALAAYLSYDRAIQNIPATGSLPLQGIIPMYRETDLKFRVTQGKVSLTQTFIADQPAFRQEFVLPSGSYVYLPRRQNYLTERNLQTERGMIFLLGDVNPATNIPKQGWQGDGRNSPLHALFRVYLGAESRNPRISISQVPVKSEAPLRFYTQAQSLQAITSQMQDSSPAGYHIALLDGYNYGAYLAFTEILLQELLKGEKPMEESFFAAQKKLAELYPLPRDHLSVVMLRN